MATSSITHNVVLTSPESITRFLDALDESKRDPMPKQVLPGRLLTDPKEISDLMARWESNKKERTK